MGVLAPLYLAGLAALSLPLILHLIRRTPRGRREFSSLMFLLPSPPRLTRRSRLDQILLLLLRLAALARTHAILADSGWTGAPLEQIVSEELTSFLDQVSCIGCSLMLNTPAAQSFSLIIHELATNAVKHGALSRPEGRITIQGSVRSCEGRDLFEFSWIENGGPPVRQPQRIGFGSSILKGMAKRFAQYVEASYHSEGLVYELQVPLGPIQASLKPSSAPKITDQLAKAAAAKLSQTSMQLGKNNQLSF